MKCSKTALKCCATYLLLILIVSASSISPLFASTVGFSSSPVNLNVGNVFNLEIQAKDFAEAGTEPLAGGRINFQFNSDVLSVNQVSVDPRWDFDPLDGQLAVSGDVWEDIFFDIFVNSALSDDGIIATVEFTAIGQGQSLLQILSSSEFYGDGFATLQPTRLTSTVNVGVQNVPVPAALWLFVSGFSILLSGKNRNFFSHSAL